MASVRLSAAPAISSMGILSMESPFDRNPNQLPPRIELYTRRRGLAKRFRFRAPRLGCSRIRLAGPTLSDVPRQPVFRVDILQSIWEPQSAEDLRRAVRLSDDRV